MSAKKGQDRTPGSGRKKGTPNKRTAAVKQALVEAFDEMGGVAALVKWGKSNRTEFYKLWGRLIPVELKNADGESFRVELIEEVVTETTALAHAPEDGPALPATADVLP